MGNLINGFNRLDAKEKVILFVSILTIPLAILIFIFMAAYANAQIAIEFLTDD